MAPMSIMDVGFLGSAGGVVGCIADFSDDFTTDNWVDADSARIGVNLTTNVLDYDLQRDGTNDKCHFDLGAGNVSDTLWTLRFKLRFTTFTENVTPKYGFFGISSITGGTNTVQDFIGFWARAVTGTNEHIKTIWADGEKLDNANGTKPAFELSTGTDYFVEIVRLTATTFKMNWFLNSNFTNPAFTEINETGLESTVVSLQFIQVANLELTGGGGTNIGIMDDVNFYNGCKF